MATARNQSLSINMVLNSAIKGANFLQASVNKLHTYAVKVEKVELLKATKFPTLNKNVDRLNKNLSEIKTTSSKIKLDVKVPNLTQTKKDMTVIANKAKLLKNYTNSTRGIDTNPSPLSIPANIPANNPTRRNNTRLVHRTINTGDVVATALAATPIVMPLAGAIGFESAITSVEAKTDTKYKKDIHLLRENALKLGATTEWKMTDVAKGQEYMTMAGFNPKQIKASMSGILGLATVGDMDLGTTADIGSNILSGFKIKASKMNMVSDRIAKTITTSNVNVAEIGNTMKYTATAANSLRGAKAFEETLALTGQLGNIGIKGTQAGTALKGMYLRLATPPKEGSKELKKLGVRAFDKKGKFKPITEIIGDMNRSFIAKKYNDKQRIKAVKKIFGMIVAPSALGLLNIGQRKLEAYQGRVHHSDGEAKRIQKMKLNTVAGQFKLLSSAVDGLGISISAKLLPPLKNATMVITGVLNVVQRWADRNPVLASTLYSVVLVGAIATVGIMTLGLVATLASRGMGVLSLGASTTTARLGLLNRVMMRSPLIILATLIAGAYYAFKDFNSAVVFAKATLAGFEEGTTALKMAFAPVLNLIDRGVKIVKDYSASLGIYSINTNTATNAGNSFGRALALVVPALIAVKLASLTLGSSVVLGALKGVGVAFRFVGTSALWLGRALLLNPLGLAISAIVGGVYLIKRDWAIIKPFWSNLWNSITTKTKKVWGQIKGVFSLSNISKHFNSIVNKIKSPFVSFFNWIGKKFAWVSSLMSSAKILEPKVALSLEEKNKEIFKNKKSLSPVNNHIDKAIIKSKPKTLRDSILEVNQPNQILTPLSIKKLPLKNSNQLSLRKLPVTSVNGITQKSISQAKNVTNNKNIKTTQTFHTTFHIKNEGGKIDEHELERAWKKVQRKMTKEDNDRQIADMTG